MMDDLDPDDPRVRREKKRRKHEKLVDELSKPNADLGKLRRLGISEGGFLSNELRKRAWPKILRLELPAEAVDPSVASLSITELESYHDYHQVKIDVIRSLHRFPPGMKKHEFPLIREKIIRVIVTVLMRNPELHYYQGFNEIAATFLLIGDESFAVSCVQSIAKSHLRAFMARDMQPTLDVLQYMLLLVGLKNQKLRTHLEQSQCGIVFALSWVLTWFCHVLDDLNLLIRLFDIFISCHPFMPVYLSAAIVVHCSHELLSTPCDISDLFPILNGLPATRLPWEELLHSAGKMIIRFPPEELASQIAGSQNANENRLLTEKAVMAWKREERRSQKKPCQLFTTWKQQRYRVFEDPVDDYEDEVVVMLEGEGSEVGKGRNDKGEPWKVRMEGWRDNWAERLKQEVICIGDLFTPSFSDQNAFPIFYLVHDLSLANGFSIINGASWASCLSLVNDLFLAGCPSPANDFSLANGLSFTAMLGFALAPVFDLVFGI